MEYHIIRFCDAVSAESALANLEGQVNAFIQWKKSDHELQFGETKLLQTTQYYESPVSSGFMVGNYYYSAYQIIISKPRG